MGTAHNWRVSERRGVAKATRTAVNEASEGKAKKVGVAIKVIMVDHCQKVKNQN